MSLPEHKNNASDLEKLLEYHRLLRIVEADCGSLLDEESKSRLMELILDRIQQLELPAALELERARELRGF